MKSKLLKVSAILAAAFLLNFVLSILQDVEYNGQDMDVPEPLRVFIHRPQWRKDKNKDPAEITSSRLFPRGG